MNTFQMGAGLLYTSLIYIAVFAVSIIAVVVIINLLKRLGSK